METKRVLISSLGAAAVVAWLAAGPAQAHHAFSAEFDANKPVKLQGTIAKVEWINPHSWFHIDVVKADGQVERWMIEGGNPAALTRRGFTKNYLQAGTEIVVEGFMSKGMPRRANGRSLTYPDGRTLFVGSSGTGAPEDAQALPEKR
jgi:hypothetical protein